MHYLPFSAWLISRTMMSSSSIHRATNGRIYVSIHLWLDILVDFNILATVNSAAVNMYV